MNHNIFQMHGIGCRDQDDRWTYINGLILNDCDLTLIFVWFCIGFNPTLICKLDSYVNKLINHNCIIKEDVFFCISTVVICYCLFLCCFLSFTKLLTFSFETNRILTVQNKENDLERSINEVTRCEWYFRSTRDKVYA